ncbi:MAG: hypothetical protein KAS16_01030, partial [Thermoplasmata archaeon]|nr:hypothetical protein [Thermoplasmata archaeon]
VSPEIATTDESGKAIFSFESRDLEGDKEYTISTIAFKTGYKNGTQSCQLMVMDHIHPPQDECDSLLPILQSSIVLVVVTIMILLSALKYTKNRNKKGKQP